jgi:hypothetical protein
VLGAFHETLQQRRREQQSPEFKLLMKQRNGVEGTISELVRGHGLRRARYKGFAKVDLQNQLVAAACNVKRWLQKVIKAASQEALQELLSARKVRLPSLGLISTFLRCLLAKLTFLDSLSPNLSCSPPLL